VNYTQSSGQTKPRVLPGKSAPLLALGPQCFVVLLRQRRNAACAMPPCSQQGHLAEAYTWLGVCGHALRARNASWIACVWLQTGGLSQRLDRRWKRSARCPRWPLWSCKAGCRLRHQGCGWPRGHQGLALRRPVALGWSMPAAGQHLAQADAPRSVVGLCRHPGGAPLSSVVGLHAVRGGLASR
jgi:hypothetical protein